MLGIKPNAKHLFFIRAIISLLVFGFLFFWAKPFFNSSRNPYQDPSFHEKKSSEGSKNRFKHWTQIPPTLNQIEIETGIPVSVFIEELGLPVDVSPDTPMKQLGKTFHFDLDEIHRIIDRFEERVDKEPNE